jgi:hypothetical protein
MWCRCRRIIILPCACELLMSAAAFIVFYSCVPLLACHSSWRAATTPLVLSICKLQKDVSELCFSLAMIFWAAELFCILYSVFAGINSGVVLLLTLWLWDTVFSNYTWLDSATWVEIFISCSQQRTRKFNLWNGIVRAIKPGDLA